MGAPLRHRPKRTNIASTLCSDWFRSVQLRPGSFWSVPFGTITELCGSRLTCIFWWLGACSPPSTLPDHTIHLPQLQTTPCLQHNSRCANSLPKWITELIVLAVTRRLLLVTLPPLVCTLMDRDKAGGKPFTGQVLRSHWTTASGQFPLNPKEADLYESVESVAL